MAINKKIPSFTESICRERKDEPVDYSELDNDEIVDNGYGFVDNRGIEVCSDRELYEIDED